MQIQHLITLDGTEITFTQGASGWPYINGERVGGMTVAAHAEHRVIGLAVRDMLYILLFADYCEAMGMLAPAPMLHNP